MQAGEVLHEVLEESCEGMHAKRREALEAGVVGALRGRGLTVTKLGRALRSEAKEKHCIKRMDRLLSNVHLRGERGEIYARLTRWLVGSLSRVVIAVDWSDLDEFGRHFVL